MIPHAAEICLIIIQQQHVPASESSLFEGQKTIQYLPKHNRLVDVVCELKNNLPTDTNITLAKIMPCDIFRTSRYLFPTYNELADEVIGHLEEEKILHGIGGTFY